MRIVVVDRWEASHVHSGAGLPTREARGRRPEGVASFPERCRAQEIADLEADLLVLRMDPEHHEGARRLAEEFLGGTSRASRFMVLKGSEGARRAVTVLVRRGGALRGARLASGPAALALQNPARMLEQYAPVVVEGDLVDGGGPLRVAFLAGAPVGRTLCPSTGSSEADRMARLFTDLDAHLARDAHEDRARAWAEEILLHDPDALVAVVGGHAPEPSGGPFADPGWDDSFGDTPQPLVGVDRAAVSPALAGRALGLEPALGDLDVPGELGVPRLPAARGDRVFFMDF